MAGRTSRSTTARTASGRAAVVAAAPALCLDGAGAEVAEVRHQLGLERVLEGEAPLVRYCRRLGGGGVAVGAAAVSGGLWRLLDLGSQRQRDLALGIDVVHP